MSDIGDAIKYLYREFILRDLLSFVTPGAIVIVSALLFRFDLYQTLTFSKLIPLILYIPVFGVFFMVGFAIQILGAEILHIIRFHTRDTDTDNYECLAKFLSKADEEEKRQRERFVVLKQMCGNGAIAILIAAILLIIKLWPPSSSVLVLIIMTILISLFLFLGHYVHVKRQMEWEDTIINSKVDTSDSC